MKVINKSYAQCLLFIVLSLYALVVPAHPRWILPTDFTISGDEDQWISFDLTASHSVFDVDKGISAENVRIISPDGDQNYLRHFFTGHRRSVFDLQFEMDGTYKIYEKRPVFYYTGYKTGNRETVKYIQGNKVEIEGRIPDRARDIRTEVLDMSTMVYVTRNAPTDSALEPKGKGLEIVPITHPSDIVQGESVTVKMMLDGLPVAGVDVEITPAGTRYRDQRRSIILKTQGSGLIVFTPDQPGPWLLATTLYSPENSPMADVRWSARYMTFEVSPE